LIIGRERNCSFPHFLHATRRDANLTNVKRKKRKKAGKKKGEKESKTKQKAEKAIVSLAALSTTAMDSEWLIYSRAGSHMSVRKDWIEDLNYRRQEVSVANNEKVYTEGSGDVMVKLNYKNSNAIKIIKCVLYVPCLMTNLVSVSKMVEKGICSHFRPARL
jgi:hypothetical protein